MKLGDKDYWQVGDEVFANPYGKGSIMSIDYERVYALQVNFWDSAKVRYTLGGKEWILNKSPDLVHFDTVNFNQDYAPDRSPKLEPKVMVTKLPHEFVKDEEVLVKDCIGNTWCYVQFSKLLIDEEYPYYSRIHGSWKYCIPYKGNEHCSCKITNCDSGKVPSDYVFPEPKEEIFRKAKLGDTVYRLYEGEYIEGKVVNAGTCTIRVETSSEVTYKKYLGTIWVYNFYGELEGQEEIGQVLFWDNPNKSKEHIFKPFDKVLVRHYSTCAWQASLFSHEEPLGGYYVFSGYYNMCIPFKGNEHLLGTTNSPEE